LLRRFNKSAPPPNRKPSFPSLALCLILSAFFLIVSSQWGHAVEKWTRVEGFSLPFRYNTAVVSFDGKILLADGYNQTWVTVDGSSWTNTGNQPYFARYSVIHNNQLYGFVSPNVPSGYETSVHRTFNGLDWEVVYSENRGRVLMATTVYQDEIYMLFHDGSFLRFDGQLKLEEFPPPVIFPSIKYSNVTLVEFKGYLHAVMEYPDNTTMSHLEVFRTDSTLQWEFVGRHMGDFWNMLKRKKMAEVYEDKLYVTGELNLFSTTGDMNPYQWDAEDLVPAKGDPFIIHDSIYMLHGMGPQILSKLMTDGAWKLITSEVFDFHSPSYDTFYAEIDDLVVISSNYYHLLLLKGGVTNLKGITIAADRFFSGQKGAEVLSFSMDVNMRDRLDITVRNQGTALQGQHIERVFLTKKEAGAKGLAPDIFVTELEPDPTDPKKWRTSQPVEVHDENELTVKMDIGKGWMEDANVNFAIEPGGIWSIKNPDFKNESYLTSTAIIEILNAPLTATAGELPPLADVEVAPRPARDVVNFVYDLAEASDVEIKIFDRSGGLVSEIHDPNKSAGNRAKTNVNVASFAPGVYYSVIKIKPATGGEQVSKKAIYVER
jgi:hypothetical protein